MNVPLLVGPQWSADGDLRIQINEALEIAHYSLGQTLLSDDILGKVGQYWVSLDSSTGKRCYFSGCCTTREVIIPPFAGKGYHESKASKRFVRSSFYGHMRSRHRFPPKETSVGSWFGFAGGMCTTAQYFEVDGVILDLSNSYWGGWMALMVLQVKSHNNLTKLPGVASGVLR